MCCIVLALLLFALLAFRNPFPGFSSIFFSLTMDPASSSLASPKMDPASCPHLAGITKDTVRALLRAKFLGEGGAARTPLRTPEELDASSCGGTPAEWALALACWTGKDGPARNVNFLHCEACAEDCDGSETGVAMMKDMAAKTSLGATCNLDVWVCLHCAAMLCGEVHAASHSTGPCPGHLFVSAHDAHVMCFSCAVYVYPRELMGGAALSQKAALSVDNIAYQWLLILGRLRHWWRIFTPAGEEEPGRPFRRGLRNYGNTVSVVCGEGGEGVCCKAGSPGKVPGKVPGKGYDVCVMPPSSSTIVHAAPFPNLTHT